MWKAYRGVAVIAMAAWSLAGCGTDGRSAARAVPEAEQAVGPAMKELYMAAAAAAPQSQAQQKVLLRMAEKASNGKELLLVMRAAVGAFPPGGGLENQSVEARVRSIVATKLMQVGTLDQLIECATEYSIDTASSRPFVRRMFELGEQRADPRVWYRIRMAASHLKVADMERLAQARGDRLAGR